MKNNKSAWFWIVASVTAIAGVVVAIALFMKRAGKKIQNDLDFDDDIFLENEDIIPSEFDELADEEDEIAE